MEESEPDTPAPVQATRNKGGKNGGKNGGKKGQKNPKKQKQDGGRAEAWWAKSNYLSLPNLLRMLEIFGQLINFWDGGGKGEKFVQEVKPLISRGVHDYNTFFVVIMEKLYKNRLLKHFREMYGLFPSDTAAATYTEEPRFYIGKDGEIFEQETPLHCQSAEEVPADIELDRDYSQVEDQNMSKLKSFYVYRTRDHIEEALRDGKPISGVLVHGSHADLMDFLVVYRCKKSFGWVKISFDDSKGIFKGGLWYAPIEMVEATMSIPPDFKAIQERAKMSTVAIPMSYGLGPDTPHSQKFCVITNWWKERQSNGRYTMPGLDPSYYIREDNYDSILTTLEDTTGNVI